MGIANRNVGGKRLGLRKSTDKVVSKILLLTALISIIAVILISLFIFSTGLPFFGEVPLSDFLFSTDWKPSGDPPSYGILSFILTSVYVTALALLFSTPVAISTAIYLAEFAKGKPAAFLRQSIELLAGIPSIIFGLFGIAVVVPFVRNVFGGNGYSILAASIILAIMILPTIINVSEVSIRAVPGSLREASVAMGATRWQTISRVLLPASKSGIVTSLVLGIGRAVGETHRGTPCRRKRAPVPHVSHFHGEDAHDEYHHRHELCRGNPHAESVRHRDVPLPVQPRAQPDCRTGDQEDKNGGLLMEYRGFESRRRAADRVAVGVIKGLSFLAIVILVLILGYIAVRGLVSSNQYEVPVVPAVSSGSVPFTAVVGTGNNMNSLAYPTLRDFFSGKVFSLRRITSVDADVRLYIEHGLEQEVMDYLGLDAEQLAKSRPTVGTAEEVLSGVAQERGGIALVYPGTSLEGYRKIKEVTVGDMVLAVHPSVVALEGNIRLSMIAQKDMERLLSGAVGSWKELGGQDLPVVRVDTAAEVKDTAGAIALLPYREAIAQNLSMLQINTTVRSRNLTLSYLVEKPVESGKYGGISTIIGNTVLMVLISTLCAAPLGIGAGRVFSGIPEKQTTALDYPFRSRCPGGDSLHHIRIVRLAGLRAAVRVEFLIALGVAHHRHHDTPHHCAHQRGSNPFGRPQPCRGKHGTGCDQSGDYLEGGHSRCIPRDHHGGHSCHWPGDWGDSRAYLYRRLQYRSRYRTARFGPCAGHAHLFDNH